MAHRPLPFYPPTESFLEACDRVGIYVEEETAVCFVHQAWSVAAPTESNPDFTSRFMNQFAEMIERDRVEVATEAGISYLLARSVDQLWWDRKALWSAYPDDHIGRPKGGARRQSSYLAQTYRHPPMGPWSEDTQDCFLFGPSDMGGRGTNDFRSLKENIWCASCVLADGSCQVRAESDGAAAARVEVRSDGKVQFNIDNLWAYTDLGFGVSVPPLTLEGGYSNIVRLRLMDGTVGTPA